MKKFFFLSAIALLSMACKNDEGPSTIPDGTWTMEKMTFNVGGTEYEITNPPSITIRVEGNVFTYQDGGTQTGSWSVDLSSMLLNVTNPDGTEASFELVSLENDRWSFVAQEVNLNAVTLTDAEEGALDLINMRLIQLGSDLDVEASEMESVKLVFVMRKR